MLNIFANMQICSLTHIRYRRWLFSVNDYFLSSETTTNAAINYFIQCPNNVQQSLNEFHTLLVDLSRSQEQLWNNIYHRCRSEISSFINNQTYQHLLVTEPTAQQVEEFIQLFNAFAKQKNIRAAEAFRLKAYLRHNILALSYIKQNGQTLCINVYRLTQARATNLYSFNLAHTAGFAHNASHTGRAHRALHWLDMLAIKQAGVALYDFCGWYHGHSDKALLNINAFKEQFGGYKVKEYSGVIYKQPLLRLLKQWR